MKILGWDFNSKMLFNPDPPKQAKEAFFSKKRKIFALIPTLIPTYFLTIY